MDPKASPSLRHVDQGGHEVGEFGGQGGELVDDHHQAGEWIVRVVVVAKVADARFAELPLPILQLGLQAPQGSGRQVLVQVGHHTNGVRQIGTGIEGASALEIDEDEVELVWALRPRQRGDERAEQLTLTGPGRPGDQRVWTVVYQVESKGAVLGHTDYSRWGLRPACPMFCNHRRRKFTADQGSKVTHLGQVGSLV